MGPEAEGTWAKNVSYSQSLHYEVRWYGLEFWTRERKQIKDLQFQNLEAVKVRQDGLFGKQYGHSKT